MGHIENLVLSFMSQLSAALPSADDPSTKPEKKQKIELELADRRKVTSDGSAVPRAHLKPSESDAGLWALALLDFLGMREALVRSLSVRLLSHISTPHIR